jgi:hypothetical protein
VRRDDRLDQEEVAVITRTLELRIVAAQFATVMVATPIVLLTQGAHWSSLFVPLVFGLSVILHGTIYIAAQWLLVRETHQEVQRLGLRDLRRIAVRHFALSMVVAGALLLFVPNLHAEIVLAGPALFGMSALLHHVLVRIAEPTLPRARARKPAHRRLP